MLFQHRHRGASENAAFALVSTPGSRRGALPNAEAQHEQVLAMPMGPTMSLSEAVPLIEAARACA